MAELCLRRAEDERCFVILPAMVISDSGSVGFAQF